jgi:hypothetical protein
MTKYGSQIRQTALAVSLAALAAGTTARADYSNTVASFNPVGYWRLNETTQPPPGDVATNVGYVGATGYGVYLNGATHPTVGALVGSADTAATFNGTGAEVSVPFAPGLNRSGPFTAEFWARPASTTIGATPFSSTDFSISVANIRKGWLFYNSAITAGQWTFRVYKPSNANVQVTGGVVSGAWQHVAGVYDGMNVALYVDGVLVGSAPLVLCLS